MKAAGHKAGVSAMRNLVGVGIAPSRLHRKSREHWKWWASLPVVEWVFWEFQGDVGSVWSVSCMGCTRFALVLVLDQFDVFTHCTDIAKQRAMEGTHEPEFGCMEDTRSECYMLRGLLDVVEGLDGDVQFEARHFVDKATGKPRGGSGGCGEADPKRCRVPWFAPFFFLNFLLSYFLSFLC